MSVSAVNFCEGTICTTSPALIASLHFATIPQNSASVISGRNSVSLPPFPPPRRETHRSIDSAESRRSLRTSISAIASS